MINDGPGIFVTSCIGAPSLNLVRLGIMRVAKSRKLSWRAAVSWITSLIRFGNGLTWSTSSSIIHMLTYTHIHVSYTCIIYMYHIHVSYTCIIYMYHIHVSYTCIIYMYHIHVSYTCIIYISYIVYIYHIHVSCVCTYIYNYIYMYIYIYEPRSKWLKTTFQYCRSFLSEMCAKHCKAIGPPKSDNLGPYTTVH